MAHTAQEIDDFEAAGELYVCQTCDYHGHVDEFGETCPKCGAGCEDETPKTLAPPVV